MTGVRHEAQTESHRLIEQLMILANEQVAGYLADRSSPTLYRVHERPDPQSVEFMVEQLASLDVPTPPLPEQHDARSRPPTLAAEISRIVAARRRRTGRGGRRSASLVLRSLKQAYYTPAQPRPRRAGQPALLPLHLADPPLPRPGGAPRAAAAALGLDDAAAPAHELEEAGVQCSAREREAMKIERDADDVCLAFLLERVLLELEPDDSHASRARWSGLIAKGAFVRFGERGLRGLPAGAPAARLVDAERAGHGARGRGPGGRLRFGDSVKVEVDRVEAAARARGSDPRRVILVGVAKKGKRKAAPGRRRHQPPGGFRYNLLDKCEAGIVLQGSEVKSLRDGGVQLKDAYADVKDGEVWLHNMHIAPYKPGAARTTSPSGRASCCSTGARSSA